MSEENDTEEEKTTGKEVTVTVEPSESAKEDLVIAKRLKEEVIASYAKRGKRPPQLETWEDIDKAIKALEPQRDPEAEREAKEKSRNALAGNFEDDEHSFPIDLEGLPLELIPFESHEQMSDTIKKLAQDSTNPERQREAQRLLGELFKKHARKSQTVELQTPLTELTRSEYEEKEGIGRIQRRKKRKKGKFKKVR